MGTSTHGFIDIEEASLMRIQKFVPDVDRTLVVRFTIMRPQPLGYAHVLAMATI